MTVVQPAEVVRRLFEALAAGDMRAVAALTDPEVRVAAPFGMWADGPGRTDVEVDRIVAVGDEVTVAGRVRVRGRGTLTDSPGAWRCTVRDGRVVRVVALREVVLPFGA